MQPPSPEPVGSSPYETRLRGLLQRESRWRLTRRGWVVAAVLVLTGVAVFLRGIHPFLAVNAPVQAEVLVVEGWVADYALKAAVKEFKRGAYKTVYVTGGPIEHGAPLSERNPSSQ